MSAIMAITADDDQTKIFAVLQQFWSALDERNSGAAAALTSPNFSVTDAFAPYHWSGPGAFTRWSTDLWAFCAQHNITLGETSIRPASRLELSGNRCYLVSSAIMSSERDGELLSQAGVMVAAMTNTGDRWTISELTWAGM